MRVLWFLIGVMLAQFVVLAADANTTVYQWVDRYDVLNFTNMEDRIPKAYEDSAESRVVDGLEGYPKYTPMTVPSVEVE